MERFSTEGRTADNETLKAALLSSSYACWRNKQHRYPVYLPVRSRVALPRPITEMSSAIRRQHGHAAYEYVKRTIERELRKTKDPYHDEFCRRCGVPEADRFDNEGETTDIDITFDDMTTVVTVRSRFGGVSRLDAEHLLQLARPWNWHNAVPTFFLASTPVKFVRDRKPFPYVPSDEPFPLLEQAEEPYLLLEHVEWEWTPGVSGGVYNILRITNSDPRNMSFVDQVIDEVLKEEATAEERDAIKKTYGRNRGERGSDFPSVQYEYTLERCIQSKFIASWDIGGLDTDDGSYRAVWIPTSGEDTGDFLLEVVKRFRYSRYAGVLPEVPTLINLLAPAVVSMLMKQLGYEGIRDELAKRGKTMLQPTSARVRARDERRRAS